MKFTEEQYQKIVEIADEYQGNSDFGIIGDAMQNSIGAKFYETELTNEIDFCESAKEMLAIFNPLTREWAHDNFVEKEDKYLWETKKTDKNGKTRKLAKDESGAIYYIKNVLKWGHTRLIAESEIKAWGYNPEMFDREEI
ncbi:MAG: hypothetical protein ABF415_06650 [Leuconostoc pseudomesenteroides]|uniref:hypothetical protein n=1 Tax=Leuconostoc pseudomesenteroides TaxID=33968 RepID=UPI0039E96D8C